MKRFGRITQPTGAVLCVFLLLIFAGTTRAVVPLTGIVVDNASFTLIAGAKVVFSDTSSSYFETQTDAAGVFALTPPKGVYTIRVVAKGYPLQYYNPNGNTEMSNYRVDYDGSSASNLTIPLTQNPMALIPVHGYVSGIVLDSAGQALSNVEIDLMAKNTGDVTADIFTDANGRFVARVPSLPHVLWASGGQRAYPKQYWSPSGTAVSMDNAAVFNVPVNDTFQVLVRMQISPQSSSVTPPRGATGGVSGKVFYKSTNMPAAGMIVVAVPDSGVGAVLYAGQYYTPFTDTAHGDGTYAIKNLPSGDYWVYARGGGNVMQFYPQSDYPGNAAAVHVDSTVKSGIDFLVRPGGTLRGRVQSSSGKPIAGITVFANLSNYFVQPQAITDSTGQFIFSGLPGGIWNLSVSDQTYFLDYSANTTKYVVQEGQTLSGAVLTLQRGGFLAGTLGSSLQDTSALSPFEIALFPDTAFSHSPTSGTAYLYESSTAQGIPAGPGRFVSTLCPAGKWFTLLRPAQPALSRSSNVPFVACPAYQLGPQQSAASLLSATQAVAVVEGDTTGTLAAAFRSNGFSFLGILRFADTARPSWARVDACIKDGRFLVPVSHGYVGSGDSVFQLAGLTEGTPYVIAAQADGYPTQYWSPDGGVSAQPSGTFTFNSGSFTRPIVNMQRTPAGYYANYTPLWVNLSVDANGHLAIQMNVDMSLAVDSLLLYSKDRSGVVTLLATMPRLASQSQYSWTDTRDWLLGGYTYTVVAKGAVYVIRSIPMGSSMAAPALSADSLWLNVYGDHFGIMISWSAGSPYTPSSRDSVACYRSVAGGAWTLVVKQSSYSTMFSDNSWDKIADAGKAFMYKVQLLRGGTAVRTSPQRTFTLSTAFINQLARRLAVGTAEPYKTIQQAIDAAGAYDEIDVDPGVYDENINLKGKFLSINGNWTSGLPPVIDGMGATAITIPYHAPAGPSDGANISGLEIRNALTGIVSAADVQVNQCLFVNITKQCVAASFDSAAMTAAAQADPFCRYAVNLHCWQCTFAGTAASGSAAFAASAGTYESGSGPSYGGLEPYFLQPPASFSANAMVDNSILYGFATAPIVVSGNAASASVSNCDVWNSAFDSAASPRVTVNGGLYRIDPAFNNLQYYFLPDSSPLYKIASNGSTIGYDDRRKYSSGSSESGPSAVQNLKVVVAGPRKIVLSWSKLPADQNAASYLVLRAPGVDSLYYVDAQSSQWQIRIAQDSIFRVTDTASTTDTFFTDTNVQINVPYMYVVAGRTASEAMGRVNMPYPPPLSSYITIIPLPAHVTTVGSSLLNFTTALLSWPPAQGTGIYRVYRFLTKAGQFAAAPDSGAVRTMIRTGAYAAADTFRVRDTSLVDSSLALGRDYVYAVSAIDTTGIGYSLDQTPLVFSYVSNTSQRFTGAVSMHVPGRTWSMIGPWGSGSLSFAAAPDVSVFHWDDAIQPDKLLSQYATTQEMRAGTGYWFYSDTDTTVSVPADSQLYAALAASQASQTIRLQKGPTGWNQVASVFPFSVAPQWLAVYDAYEWDADLNQYTRATVIKPWKAYWIQSDADTALPLRGLPMPGAVLAKRASGLQWELKVSLAGAASRDPDNYCGVVSQPGARPSALARPKPPQAFNFPQLFFAQSAQGARLAKLYKCASDPVGARFEWMVGLSPAKENMTVTVKGVESIPKEVFVFWVHGGVARDLRKAAVAPIPAHKETQYGYIVVTRDSRDIALYTGKFELRKTYPNPFVSIATIEFLVPYSFADNGAKLESERRSVTLDVYNIAGRRVRSLAAGTMDVGFHRVMWNGTNDGGAPAASGFYVVRLAGRNVQSVVRLIKMR
jgi:hypothetical protein